VENIKMGCEQFEEIAALLAFDGDGGLVSGDEKELFDGHIKICGGCAALYDELKMISAEVKGLSEPELDESFHDETMALIKSQIKVKAETRIMQVRRPRIQRYVRYFGAAAAAVLAVTIVSVAVLNMRDRLGDFTNDGVGLIPPPTTAWDESIVRDNYYEDPGMGEPNTAFGDLDNEAVENGGNSRVLPSPTGIPVQEDMPSVQHTEGEYLPPAMPAAPPISAPHAMTVFPDAADIYLPDESVIRIAVDDVESSSRAIIDFGAVYSDDDDVYVMSVSPLDYGEVTSLLYRLGEVETVERRLNERTAETVAYITVYVRLVGKGE
jgi:hypothetical protein